MSRGCSHLHSRRCGSSIANDPIQNLVFCWCAFVLFLFQRFLFRHRRSTCALYCHCFGWQIASTTMDDFSFANHAVCFCNFVLVVVGAMLDIWIGGLVFVCLITVIFVFAKALVYLCSVVAAPERTSHPPFSFSFRRCFMFYFLLMVCLTFGSIFLWFWLVCGLLVYVVSAVATF